MAFAICEILEIGLADPERTIRLACPPGMIPAPGQYLLAAGLGADEILPTTLFLTRAEGDSVELCGELPTGWTPGMKIHVRGPFGIGFRLPAKARRVAVVSLTEHYLRLLPVIQLANRQNAGVALFSTHLVVDLPAEVEALPLETVKEAWSWADYMAVEARFEQLTQLREFLGLRVDIHPTFTAELLVLTPMPCGGMADCGVCSVNLNGRQRLVCKDGPVFELISVD